MKIIYNVSEKEMNSNEKKIEELKTPFIIRSRLFQDFKYILIVVLAFEIINGIFLFAASEGDLFHSQYGFLTNSIAHFIPIFIIYECSHMI